MNIWLCRLCHLPQPSPLLEGWPGWQKGSWGLPPPCWAGSLWLQLVLGLLWEPVICASDPICTYYTPPLRYYGQGCHSYLLVLDTVGHFVSFRVWGLMTFKRFFFKCIAFPFRYIRHFTNIYTKFQWTWKLNLCSQESIEAFIHVNHAVLWLCVFLFVIQHLPVLLLKWLLLNSVRYFTEKRMPS